MGEAVTGIGKITTDIKTDMTDTVGTPATTGGITTTMTGENNTPGINLSTERTARTFPTSQGPAHITMKENAHPADRPATSPTLDQLI